MRLMRAAWYERKGRAADVLQLGQLPRPEPGPDEVLVAVKASAVNPSDTKARGGARGNLAMPFPRVIPHQDGAGVMLHLAAGGTVGESGVARQQPGGERGRQQPAA